MVPFLKQRLCIMKCKLYWIALCAVWSDNIFRQTSAKKEFFQGVEIMQPEISGHLWGWTINPNPKLFKFVTLQYILDINHLDLLTDAVILKCWPVTQKPRQIARHCSWNISISVNMCILWQTPINVWIHNQGWRALPLQVRVILCSYELHLSTLQFKKVTFFILRSRPGCTWK